MSEQPDRVEDPDADPENLSPRDDRPGGDEETYADPDADPDNLNPRDDA